MLTIFRRHVTACRFKSRRDRNCKCPIAVEGSLNGQAVRQQLETRDWNTANAIIHRWERQQYVGAERENVNRVTVKAAVESYLADCEARHLSELTLRKYRAALEGNPATRNLRKDLTPTKNLLTWCVDRKLEFVDELSLERLREYRAGLVEILRIGRLGSDGDIRGVEASQGTPSAEAAVHHRRDAPYPRCLR